MKFGSMFSGIEAASVAWNRLGWTCTWVAEIEPFACAVLAHHYPDVPNLGDVTKVNWSNVERPDLIVFGSPCQSFSAAGKRLGLSDPRGNLALYALGVVDKLRPSWFVFENVPGLLSSNGGRDFGAFLGTVEELGYSGCWSVLDAQWFGVPQRRRRLFFVGHLGDWQRCAEVLSLGYGVQGHTPPSRRAWSATTALTANGPGAGGGPDDNAAQGSQLVASTLQRHAAKMWVDSPMVIANKIEANYVSHTLKADGFDGSEDGTGRGTPLIPVAFTCKDYGGDAGDVAPTLRSMNFTDSHANAGGQLAVAFTPGTLSESAVRRLTPGECESLQGFPQGYTDVPYRKKKAADGPRYRALDNSMAVPVMRWIGQRIDIVNKTYRKN